MIEGLILGLMTFISLVLTFWKLPKRIQQWLFKHKLFTDFGAGITVFMILGTISKSIVAIVGAITTSLLVGATLEITGNSYAKQITNSDTTKINRSHSNSSS